MAATHDAVAIVPVVSSSDPWQRADVIAVRVNGRPLLEQLTVRLAAAGLAVHVGVAGDGVPLGTFVSICQTPRQAGYAGVLASLVAALPREVRVVVVHDTASPLTPASTIRRVVAEALKGRPALLTRDVFETVKTMVDGAIGETIPRDSLQAVHAPLAVPAGLLFDLADSGDVRDVGSFVELYQLLRSRTECVQVQGSALSQMFRDTNDLTLLECAEDAFVPD